MQTANIDLSQNGPVFVFQAMQGDTDRQIQIILYDGGTAYDASGDAISIWYDNGAGNAGNFSDGVSISGSAVTVTLNGNLTAVPGKYGLAAMINRADGKISTWYMGLVVGEVPGYGSAAAGEYFEAFQAGDLAAQISAVSARVSNIIANGTPTEGNTELLDIRTGWNGTVYSTAGDAVRGQAKEAVKSSEISVSSTNYTNFITDADNAEVNVIYYISATITSEMVANLPEYGIAAGLLRTESWSSKSPTSGVLQTFTTLNHAYFRFKTASGWQPWVSLFKPEYLQSSNINLTPDSYSGYFSDANSAPSNRVFYLSSLLTSDMVKNLPEYGAASILRTFTWSPGNDSAGLQILTTASSQYFRIQEGSSWAAWVPIFKPEYFQSADASVTPNSYTNYFTDANNAPSNRIYYLSALITSDMVANLPEYGAVGFLVTMTWNPGKDNARTQTFTTTDSMYFRVLLTTGQWGSWNQVSTVSSRMVSKINSRAYQVLKRVGVCGDSLSVGYIYNKETQTPSRRNETYSWPHNLGAEYGGEYILLGQAGYDCTKFLNGDEGYGLPYAQQPENKCPVYIICLGYNDASDTAPDVGTPSDVGTDANTFYGLYSKIISELQSINPGCIVVCMNFASPANVGKRVEIQQAIEYIATSASLPNVCLCDLSKYEVYYTGESEIQDNILSGVHYTAVGYQLMVEPIKMALSDTINSNQELFSQINFIQ